MPAGEQEPSLPSEPYYQAARFPTEQSAGRAYFQAQRLVFKTECDLSAYRLQLNRVWHVAVLGKQPTQELDASVRKILAAGEPTTLPAEALQLLKERRARAIRQGPWVERHHQPGEPL